MSTIPVIKGRLGNTDFFEATMNARELIQIVRPPTEMDQWANFGIDERMQREPEKKRVAAQLAPYLARSADRFFGSIIVLIWDADITFESLAEVVPKLPSAYQKNAKRMGFLTIEGGTLVVLDGQHRLLAVRMVIAGEVPGAHSSEISRDDICVIFIKHEDFTKTRRIFNTVNRYAKPTTRGDNILTSEDDGYAIVARRLLQDDQPLHARKNGKGPEDVVDWKSNALAPRSVKLTTISAVYESCKVLLDLHGVAKLDPQNRPTEEELDHYLELCSRSWTSLATRIVAYRDALTDVSKIPDMRKDAASTSLLFKPAGQIALVGGIAAAVTLSRKQLTFDDAVRRVNSIPDWSMSAPIWRDIIVKAGGAIDPKAEALQRMKSLLTYLLAADVMEDAQKLAVWKSFNAARHSEAFREWEKGSTNGRRLESQLEDLPEPVAGRAFTTAKALKLTRAA
jgi:DNA sulfur modification protein DndB